MDVYRDPVTQCDKVIILIGLIGGVTEVEFLLLGSGPGTIYARVTYRWPQASFNIEQLFEKEIKANKIPSCHPKIIALKKSLENCRDSCDATPIGQMDLTLPIPVLTTSNSFSKKGRKNKDGSLAMLIELTAYESLYSIKKGSKRVIFESESEEEKEEDKAEDKGEKTD